jgi:hypothetical protein
MEELGIAVAVLVAVGGWIANGVLTRRAARRQTRVEYLLSAYRRLEAASNRGMTAEHEAALESAISDIQLLGTPQQVDLAERLAREIAATRAAGTGPLLEDLRATLRRELQLEKAPPRLVWLRMSGGPEWADESAFVRARIDKELVEASPVEALDHQVVEMAVAEPSAVVVAAFSRLEAAMRARVGDSVPAAPDASLMDLLGAAAGNGLVTQQTAEAIEGLAVMRNLAVHGRRDLTESDAREFIALVDGVLFALKRGT